MGKSTFKNNKAKVKATIAERMPDALRAMGNTAADLVRDNMESGYGKPIRDTGALIADVASQVNGDVAEVGNTLYYSLFVHEGTRKMSARHYINDAILNDQAKKKIADAAKEELFP